MPLHRAIPARRSRGNLACGREALNQRTALVILTPKRLAAALRDTAFYNSVHNTFAKILG